MLRSATKCRINEQSALKAAKILSTKGYVEVVKNINNVVENSKVGILPAFYFDK